MPAGVRSHQALEEAPAPVKCHGHCRHGAGEDECAQQLPFLTATGGSGCKPLLGEESQSPAVPGHDLFKKIHNHGSRLRRGVRC